MSARRYHTIRRRLEDDSEKYRRRLEFMADYEWLEGYWNEAFDGLSSFVQKTCDYYWRHESVKEAGRRYAGMECVGNSDWDAYLQTGEIGKATMHLRYHAGLFAGEAPTCENLDCRTRKRKTGHCRPEKGTEWPTGNHGGFKAVMEITRQIRNNLVHGNKLQIEVEQLERNHAIIEAAAVLLRTVWRELPAAEARAE